MENKQPPDRIAKVTHSFYALLPMVVSIIGILFLLALILIPDMRQAEFIAAYTGLLVVVGGHAAAVQRGK